MRLEGTHPGSHDVIPLSCACAVLTNSPGLSPNGLLLLDCNRNELDSMNSSIGLRLLNSLLRICSHYKTTSPLLFFNPFFLSFGEYASDHLPVLPFLTLRVIRSAAVVLLLGALLSLWFVDVDVLLLSRFSEHGFLCSASLKTTRWLFSHVHSQSVAHSR